jgi:hypothetical protein
MAHVRQSRPYSGCDHHYHVKVLQTLDESLKPLSAASSGLDCLVCAMSMVCRNGDRERDVM